LVFPFSSTLTSAPWACLNFDGTGLALRWGQAAKLMVELLHFFRENDRWK
jgi:hypothetical protein